MAVAFAASRRARELGGHRAALQSDVPLGKNLLPDFPPAVAGRSAHGSGCQSAATRGAVPRYRTRDAKRRIRSRLDFEITTIVQMDHAGYFQSSPISSAGEGSSVPVGPGRGSASSSSRTLGITDLDPLRYGLCSSASESRHV
jgi:DNA polymerase III alpha subunit